ncbi:hypothetical protein KJE20_13861 [Pyrenophora tritici-repentis]|uniref:Uncharacterized protein n=1 Tax=Pyrenophora tritici-repentis TaxID=45151 RepID=A0A922NIV0_9PLEO|nr:hypothetical protein Ptr86124_004424 [Pyrenophora tritici-repentis]KAI1676612.1 hypothetical protein KJE20_13861 [Pyrenophora tritici-repentis]
MLLYRVLYNAPVTAFFTTHFILNTPDDWFTWLFIRRDVANRHGLWQYINPDVARELLPELTEATGPQLTHYQAGAVRLSNLTADDRESYRWECDRWERRRSEYRSQQKALADLNTDISKTIAVRHIHLIKDQETPYDRLIALKKVLCPTDATRRRELADKYNALKTAPRAAKKVEQWLTDWEDFLIACKALDQEYATSCLGEFFRYEARGTTAEISSLETYVAGITTYLCRTKPHSTGLAVSAVELGITKPTETPSTGRAHRDGARPTPTCVCGKQHWYTDCFILGPRHPARPKTLQPAAEAVRKVEEARKDSKINARIKAALARWLAHQPESTGSLRVDDGEPPANTDTFVLSTDPLLKYSHDGYDSHDGHTSHDSHNRVCHNDDVVIAIDAHTEPAGAPHDNDR